MKKFLKIIKMILIVLLAIIVLIVCTVFTLRFVRKSSTKIDTKYGINESIYVDLNGVEQYINIRGNDISNPVILFLHGGPGFPITYLSTYHQLPIEERYTVINWDQRGCGRTYYKSPDAELSIDAMLEDVDSLVEYAKERFNKDKVIIIGQSWGSVPGSTYAIHHTENVLAYVGVGQVIDFDDGKIYTAQEGMKLASDEDKATLQTSIDEFQKADNIDDVDIANLTDLIVVALKYLKGDNEKGGLNQAWMGMTSPYMSIQDIKWYMNAADTQKIFDREHDLVNYMYFEFDIENLGYEYDVPICYIQGSNDFITPTGLVQDYYDNVKAPKKQFYTVAGAGHTPFLDMPEEYAQYLMEFLDSIEE